MTVFENMKKSLTTSLVTAALLALLLASPGAAFASQPINTKMSLGLAGGIVDVGVQHYTVRGGQLQLLLMSGNPTPVTYSQLQYSIEAFVNGASVNGQAQFTLSAQTASGYLKIIGNFEINSQLAAVQLTTSSIPAFFVGVGNLLVNQNGQTTTDQTAMLFESPYLNPFGGPLTIESEDGLVAFSATYYKAISQWSGLQVAGTISNSAGTTTLGTFGQTANLTENLLQGTENDQGVNQLILTGFTGTLADLNGQYTGPFSGTSTIPAPGPIDCSSETGLPSATCTLTPSGQLVLDTFDCSGTPGFLPGTCTATGSNSQGSFNHARSDQKITVSGTYSIAWSVPAYTFTGTVQATFKSN